MATDTAPHLAPDRCYICGGSEHADTTATGGHTFWSNAAAKAEFAAEDRKHRSTHSPEAAYVAEHRPY